MAAFDFVIIHFRGSVCYLRDVLVVCFSFVACVLPVLFAYVHVARKNMYSRQKIIDVFDSKNDLRSLDLVISPYYVSKYGQTIGHLVSMNFFV